MQCTVCLDSEGTVVQKGCCCRGDAGAVHLDCLIELATHVEDSESDWSAWVYCQTCKGAFTGSAQIGLAHARCARHESRGDDESVTLGSRLDLANALHSAGQYVGAAKIQEEVLEVCRRLHGTENSLTLTVVNNLALTFNDQGKYADAIELQKEVLAIRKRVSGDLHRDTLTAAGNLALTYFNLCKFDLAAELELSVLDARRRTFGEENSETLTAAGVA